MAKNTEKLVEELGLCPDFTKFYDENRSYLITESLSEMLARLLEVKGMTRFEAIKRAELSESYGYQIFSGLRVPSRGKLLALAVGMGLTLDETQALLAAADFAPLYVKVPFDSVVLYGICHQLTVPQINTLLYQYDLHTLG